MQSVLDHLALLDGDDAVALPDRGEAVGDDEDGAVLRDPTHIALDRLFGFQIESAGRLVEDQDPGIGHQGARNSDTLTLAAREGATTFADLGIVAFGELQDEVMGAGELRRLHHLFQRHTGIGKRDILSHRAVEEYILLQDAPYLAPQLGGIDHGEINAVDEDPAAFRHIKTLDELRQGGFAGTQGADDANRLAGGDLEIAPLEYESVPK